MNFSNVNIKLYSSINTRRTKTTGKATDRPRTAPHWIKEKKKKRSSGASSVVSRGLQVPPDEAKRNHRETNSGTSFRIHVTSNRGVGGKQYQAMELHRIGAVFSPLLPPGRRGVIIAAQTNFISCIIPHHTTYHHITWNMFVPFDTAHWQTDARGCTRRIPIHTEYFHSSRATTLSFSVNAANTVSF